MKKTRSSFFTYILSHGSKERIGRSLNSNGIIPSFISRGLGY